MFADIARERAGALNGVAALPYIPNPRAIPAAAIGISATSAHTAARASVAFMRQALNPKGFFIDVRRCLRYH